MINFDELKRPFAPEAISWRIGSTNKAKTKGMALAYIDARDVQDRLDQVCTVGGWQNRYPHAHGKTVCEIGIFIGDEWIWKADGAGDSDVEAEKGALSDAFKRAAVRWGVGRYLYDLDSHWVEIEAINPDAAKPSYRIKASEYDRLNKIAKTNGTRFMAQQQPSQQAEEIAAEAHKALEPVGGATVTTKTTMTWEKWVELAKVELLELKTPSDMADWMRKRSKKIEELREKDKTLWNAINVNISNRNEELQQQAGRKAA